MELQYLFGMGRITVGSEAIFQDLRMRIGIRECEASFSSVVSKSLELNWTRDPFDRIIVAQASLQNNAKLITKDRKIGNNYRNVVW